MPMDGDRQNDPRDIPRLVAKLDEVPGYDIVSGWRKARKDKWLSRRLPSVMANRLVRRVRHFSEKVEKARLQVPCFLYLVEARDVWA